MNFRLASPDETYRRLVQIRVPGAAAPQPLRVHWRLLDDAAVNGLLAESNSSLVRAVLVGWEGLQEHDGTPIPFDAENLERVAGIAYLRRPLVDEYLRFCSGLPEKNSATPPASGAAAATEH